MAIERRKHARVAVPLSALMVVGSKEFQLQVRDISAGGIFLYTNEPPAPVGKQVQLKLALTQGIKPVAMQAEVVRVVMAPPEQGGGILGIGLHFVKLSKQVQDQLEDLIQRAMLGVGTMGRAYPRISCMLDVRFLTPSVRRAVLRDIGEGGVGLLCEEPVVKDSLVVVEIVCDEVTTLKLSGVVVSYEEISAMPGKYRVGIKFVGLAPEARKELQTFLKRLWKEKPALSKG